MFIVHALSIAFAMFWEILWALILGFTLSGIVQAVVSKKEMTRLLPDDSPRTLTIAWNYTTILDVVFLAVAAALLWRAAATGGFKMLGMMNMAPAGEGARHQPRHAH